MHYLNCFNMKNHLLIYLIASFCWVGWSFQTYANTLQVNNISSSNPTFKCFGDATTLSVGDYTTYLWSTGETTPTIRVTTPGYFSVIVTDASGCSGVSNKFRLTGKGGGQLRSEIEDIYGNPILCAGESVTLVGDRNPMFRYWWSTGDTLSYITLTESASIFLVTIDPNGCELNPSEGVNVEVFDATPPNVTVNGPIIFCNENDVTTLTATYDSTYDFIWSTGERSSTITLNTPGTYYAVSSNSVGCEVTSNSVTVQAVNQNIPQVSSDGDLILCAGEELTLDTRSVSPAYAWSNGATTPSITVSEGGVYSLSLVDANGCKSVPATIEVQKPDLMIPEILYSGSLIFCDGSSLILSANINPYYIWQWQNGSHTFDTLVTRSGTFHITGIDQMSGCVVHSDTIVVAVGEIEDPVISIASGSNILCEGDSVILESSPAAEYYWLGPGTDIVDNVNQRFAVHEGGIYELAVVNDFGCVAAAEPIEIFLDTLANDPQIYGHRNFNINVFKTYHTVTASETQVEWSIRGGSIDFPNKDTISVIWTDVTDLELCVKYTSPKGCVVKKACINDMMISVDEHVASSINIYPNPANSYINIEVPYKRSVENVTIYCQTGKQLLAINQFTGTPIDISNLPAGMYCIAFELDKVPYYKKLYKQ